jgi:polysaccharide export outer membrane protein
MSPRSAGDPGEAMDEVADGDQPRKLDVKPGQLKMRAPRPGPPVAVAAAPDGNGPGRPPEVSRPDERAGDSPAVAPDFEEVDPRAPYRLRVGDPIYVIAPSTLGESAVYVDEDGEITMLFINKVKAQGLTVKELEKNLFDAYVPDYFVDMTLDVVMAQQRSYFITGEIRAPGRFQYIGGMTLMEVISTSGGVTPFANKKKITITRNGKTKRYNFVKIEKNPELDVAIEAGDIIKVHKSWH